MFSAKHSKNNIGSIGEEIAAEYIKKMGYKLLFRNYRDKKYEIDIIAKDKNGLTIFFEVKTMIRNNKKEVQKLLPEDNFTIKKRQDIKNAIKMFSAKHQNYIFNEYGWQTDLLAITIYKNNNSFNIKHYKNVSN